VKISTTTAKKNRRKNKKQVHTSKLHKTKEKQRNIISSL